ncbi:hypothetical protein [Chryseobacterium indoltheticum]|uniref:hypothetical protein n=1 Tax=Chryseobacterium indoltheticum TaxID=254 RepID=UPI003F494AB3
MKKLIAFLFLIFFSLGFAQDKAVVPDQLAIVNNTERIINFHADIDVDKNSGLSITEK